MRVGSHSGPRPRCGERGPSRTRNPRIRMTRPRTRRPSTSLHRIATIPTPMSRNHCHPFLRRPHWTGRPARTSGPSPCLVQPPLEEESQCWPYIIARTSSKQMTNDGDSRHKPVRALTIRCAYYLLDGSGGRARRDQAGSLGSERAGPGRGVQCWIPDPRPSTHLSHLQAPQIRSRGRQDHLRAKSNTKIKPIENSHGYEKNTR